MILQDFVKKFLKKNISEGTLEEIDKNILSHLPLFCSLRGPGMWNWVNPLKKENLRQKSFSDNVVY